MFYITTSRPYTNAEPHLGTTIDPLYADVYARYQRMLGNSVFFSMATDEHSAKIADEAENQGKGVKEYVDEQYQKFDDAFKKLNITADEFSQSSDKKHIWFANLAFNKLLAKNLIYKKAYEGLYCKGCEDFYSSSQLVNGKCPVHTNYEIQTVNEENYFFKITEFKDTINHYLDTVDINDSSYVKEMKNFVKDIRDISISRDAKRVKSGWGVRLAVDPEHLIYIWFEALLTYLTPLIPDELFEGWVDGDSDLKTTIEGEVWEILSENTPQNLQVIGSDNTKFHIVIWPAVLAALGLEPIKSIIIHGMINDADGKKFAKSLGNGVSFSELYEQFGEDGYRFFILYYCNSGGDTNFDWNKLTEVYNTVLGNNLGNLVMRVCTLVANNLDGDVDLVEAVDLYRESKTLSLDFSGIDKYLTALKPEAACKVTLEEIGKINKYLEENKPWELVKPAKESPQIKEKLDTILKISVGALLESLPFLSLFLPASAEVIENNLRADKITKLTPLFPRIDLKA
jgi:methionyl-tRNA synthetase